MTNALREHGISAWWVGLAGLLVMVVGAMGFETPSENQTRQAIGTTAGLPAALQKALEPGTDFEPAPAPGPHDWLAVHPEPGQSFAQFVESKPNRPDEKRRIIYLQPLGAFRPEEAPPVEGLREYAALYFALEARVLPPLTLNEEKITSRRNPATRSRQLLTTDVLNILKQRIPADAFCLLGITMEDLYPEPSWNFVFAQASLRERIGVYSFARYDPAFYHEARGADHDKTLLRRSAKVLVHETGHMFGLHHCIYYRCVFNGSNHLAESDARPLRACPADLHKLQHSVGFDVVERYAALYRFYRRTGFDDEADWTKRRLEWTLGRAEAEEAIEASARPSNDTKPSQ